MVHIPVAWFNSYTMNVKLVLSSLLFLALDSQCKAGASWHQCLKFPLALSTVIQCHREFKALMNGCQLAPALHWLSSARNNKHNTRHRASTSMYSLTFCVRHHNKSLIIKTNFLNDTDFIVRMLYKYSYWRSYCRAIYTSPIPSAWTHLLPSFAICIVLFFLPRMQF